MRRFSAFFLCAVLVFSLPRSMAQQASVPPSHNEVLIKNAVVMTVTHGNVQNGSVYIKDGKIAAVGKNVSSVDAPP